MKHRLSHITPERSLARASRFTLLAILLLAAALRFYRLDAQSFWNDEGSSARIAERTLDLIVAGAAGDIHPPGYYLLLHYWRALLGQSEFALRAFSAAAGLALIALTYLLGRHLFDEATGLTAAFLGAISPFAIYYAQEARMYTLLGALAAAATYLLTRFLPIDGPVRRPMDARPPSTPRPGSSLVAAGIPIAYILTAAAGLYTQYAFALVLLVHNAAFAAWWLVEGRRSADRWRWLAVWIGTQAAVVLLYLPWLEIAVRSTTGWTPAGQAYALGPALLDVLRVLGAGLTLPLEQAGLALALAGALLLAGLWPRRDDRASWRGVGGVALWLLLPIGLILALDLYKEAWLKFLIVVLPPFHLLVAHGIGNLASLSRLLPHAVARAAYMRAAQRLAPRVAPRVARMLLCLLAAALTLPSLHNLYFNPAYARDDYRQIAADVAAVAQPGEDTVVLNAPNQWEVFTYYYPDRDVYPAPYRPDPEEVEAFLSPLVGRYRRLHVVYWGDAESDPGRLIEAWLAAHAYKAGDRWYGRVRLAVYGIASLPETPAVELKEARFGEAIDLRGYALEEGPHAPGTILPVTLFWEARTSIGEPYKVTVQLLDGAGQLITQHDGEPGAGFAPTPTWQPGRAVADRHGIPLPADLPAGRYTLLVAVYHAYTGQRLPTALAGEEAGNHLVLAEVEIVP